MDMFYSGDGLYSAQNTSINPWSNWTRPSKSLGRWRYSNRWGEHWGRRIYWRRSYLSSSAWKYL